MFPKVTGMKYIVDKQTQQKIMIDTCHTFFQLSDKKKSFTKMYFAENKD